ncbi:uncharacterized protein [Rutidosis leptorrhynchoides]|uniref:uncharacterized protein isoform X2 n=1 Tax=Rutidosis leptorrhynchoides TaxID=125765 RepID=UPI003A992457
MIRYLNSRWTNEQVNLITDMVSVRICAVFLKLFHKKVCIHYPLVCIFIIPEKEGTCSFELGLMFWFNKHSKQIVAKHWNRLIKQVLINHIGIFYMSTLQLEIVYQGISLNSIILLGYNWCCVFHEDGKTRFLQGHYFW